ncbi:Uncharacterised protein [Candidatus Gugararchaeum adminiculabundum]|nr:Uncharacterised protein [Candidatus Gugararchaeum adminiculabundum]
MAAGKLRLGLANRLEIALDNGGAEHCFMSHAHTDHLFSANGRKLIASEETRVLAGSDVESAEKIQKIDGVKMRLAHAGHILGSSQLVIEDEGAGKKICYTGDFKLQKGITCAKGEMVECDELMIEGTYGSQGMNFPEREQVGIDLAEWVQKKSARANVLIGGYPLGKSQELVAILNKHAGIVPIVHQKIEEKCKLYEKLGVKLKRIAAESNEAEKLLPKGFVAIVPPQYANPGFASKIESIYNRETLTVSATGWSIAYRLHTDASFPLSDHADLGEIISYAKGSGAKKVWCCLGNEESLSAILRKCGIDAAPFNDEQSQLKLTNKTFTRRKKREAVIAPLSASLG